VTFIDRIIRKWRVTDEECAADVLATLISAAHQDEAFRRRVMIILQLPANQRESMVTSAVAEMKLRGESTAIQRAFAAIATPEGADLASRLLENGNDPLPRLV
jgi:hypothetical protein